jgi:hypothetical protein
LAFKEQWKVKKPIFGIIRNSYNQNIIWREMFTRNIKKEILERITKIHDSISGNREYEPIKACLKVSRHTRVIDSLLPLKSVKIGQSVGVYVTLDKKIWF